MYRIAQHWFSLVVPFDYAIMFSLWLTVVFYYGGLINASHPDSKIILIFCLVAVLLPYILLRCFSYRVNELSGDDFIDLCRQSMMLASFAFFAIIPTFKLISQTYEGQEISIEIMVGVTYAFLPVFALFFFFVAYLYNKKKIYLCGLGALLFFMSFYLYIYSSFFLYL